MKIKKIISLVLVLALAGITALTVTAADRPRLVDDADIISDENEQVILDYLDEKSAQLEFDIAVLTVDSIYGYDIVSYADDYFDNYGFGYGENADGILLVIAMDTREWAFSTSGFGITVFGDSELGRLEDEMVSELSDGNYAQGIYNYAQYAVYYVEYAKEYGYGFSDDGYYTDEYYDGYGQHYTKPQSEPASPQKRLAISGVIGVIVSLIVVMIMRSKMNTVHKNTAASDYVRENSLDITRANDVFVNRTVSKTRKVQSETTHHGGGSSHISSGGHSHGGSHGHF